jgi:hypothetical protein
MTKVTKILWWMKAYMRGRNGEGHEKNGRTRGEKDTRREGHKKNGDRRERFWKTVGCPGSPVKLITL